MKSSFLIVFLSALLIFSCGKKQTNPQRAGKETAMVTEEQDSPVRQSMTKYQNKIKEALFMHFRAQVDGLDNYKLIKYENIEFDGEEAVYTLVTFPKSEVDRFNKQNERTEASLISWSFENADDLNVDDSLSIKGIVTVNDSIKDDVEKSPVSLKIIFEGRWRNSTLSYSPYEGPQRTVIYDGVEANLVVDVNKPRIYSRGEMYLKARIFELKDSDLSNYSKEDLAFLRNEIFARHGHVFKTDKMKNYFDRQSWYIPFSGDATTLLNEIEKKNVQLIKSLEEA